MSNGREEKGREARRKGGVGERLAEIEKAVF